MGKCKGEKVIASLAFMFLHHSVLTFQNNNSLFIKLYWLLAPRIMSPKLVKKTRKYILSPHLQKKKKKKQLLNSTPALC